jgi:hypothetical protein
MLKKKRTVDDSAEHETRRLEPCHVCGNITDVYYIDNCRYFCSKICRKRYLTRVHLVCRLNALITTEGCKLMTSEPEHMFDWNDYPNKILERD